MNRLTKLALSVFVVGLLAGGCNAQLSPPASHSGSATPTGGSGAGGFQGAGGSGAGGSSACASSDELGCVATCSLQNPARAPFGCADNVPICPNGFVPFASCPQGSCVRYQSCCNGSNGALTDPECGDDGMLSCAAGSHLTDNECIPPSLGVTTCKTLDSQPCGQPGQLCWSDNVRCSCGVFSDGDGGITWSCYDLPIIPP